VAPGFGAHQIAAQHLAEHSLGQDIAVLDVVLAGKRYPSRNPPVNPKPERVIPPERGVFEGICIFSQDTVDLCRILAVIPKMEMNHLAAAQVSQ